MNDKDTEKKAVQPQEPEAVELNLDQLEQVAGGDRPGKHEPPVTPDNKH